MWCEYPAQHSAHARELEVIFCGRGCNSYKVQPDRRPDRYVSRYFSVVVVYLTVSGQLLSDRSGFQDNAHQQRTGLWYDKTCTGDWCNINRPLDSKWFNSPICFVWVEIQLLSSQPCLYNLPILYLYSGTNLWSVNEGRLSCKLEPLY